MKLSEKLLNIDKRIIFVFVALSVIIPILFKLTFPEYPTQMTRDIFEAIEEMPKGSKLLFSMDYDPPSEPELGPMSSALLRHTMTRGHKIYFMTLWPTGQQQVTNVIEKLIKVEFPDAKYGVDYLNLGFKAGAQGVITVVNSNIRKLYTSDVHNTPLSKLPMMRNINKLGDFEALINTSGGYPGTKEWIQFGTDPSDIKYIGGVTAVTAPLLYPYYPKQMVGMLGGIKGAAEYEALLAKNFERYSDKKYQVAIVRWGPQTVAHIVIVLFIILGNVVFFINKKNKAAQA